MCWAVNGHQARYLETLEDVEEAISDGEPVFASLAGAVYLGGAVAPPFDKPLREEAVFSVGRDGDPAKAKPAGTRAAYKVVRPSRDGRIG